MWVPAPGPRAEPAKDTCLTDRNRYSGRGSGILRSAPMGSPACTAHARGHLCFRAEELPLVLDVSASSPPLSPSLTFYLGEIHITWSGFFGAIQLCSSGHPPTLSDSRASSSPRRMLAPPALTPQSALGNHPNARLPQTYLRLNVRCERDPLRCVALCGCLPPCGAVFSRDQSCLSMCRRLSPLG